MGSMTRREIKAEIKKLEAELAKEFKLSFKDYYSDKLNIKEDKLAPALLFNINNETQVRLELRQCKELVEDISEWLETVEQRRRGK